jgi:hypothetical protein
MVVYAVFIFEESKIGDGEPFFTPVQNNFQVRACDEYETIKKVLLQY